MDHLNWELSVLSRAIAFSNLSGAASHVGISQPQLSRIVSKLESQLEVVLLDRESKRKSAWTPAAFKLVEIYSETFRQFHGKVSSLIHVQQLSHVKIGTLEGLTSLASTFSHELLKKVSVKVVELQVEDLNDLEELFFKRELDFMFTIREPGKKKFKYSKKLGFQTLEKVEKPGTTRVMSSFEFGAEMQGEKNSDGTQVFVSNSLEVRRQWLEKFGGKGVLPTEIRKDGNSKGKEVPVLLIAGDELPAALWQQVSSFKF